MRVLLQNFKSSNKYKILILHAIHLYRINKMDAG